MKSWPIQYWLTVSKIWRVDAPVKYNPAAGDISTSLFRYCRRNPSLGTAVSGQNTPRIWLVITSLPGEARSCQDTLADLHYKAVFLSSAVKQTQHLESSRERLVQDNKTLETRVDILKDGLNAESALSEEVEVDSERESSGLRLLGQRWLGWE